VLRSGVRVVGATDAHVNEHREATARPRAILLDIEGTTTPLAFVTHVLFPYVRQRLRSHLESHAHAPEYHALITRLGDEYLAARRSGEPVPAPAEEPDAVQLTTIVAFVEWLMDQDRKLTPLKELQGKIWQDGYQRRDLIGQVFTDVRPALERWRSQGVQVGIFSSGSVLAQQLLFRYSSAGDLTSLLNWYFDTNVGAKVDPESYHRIARTIDLPADSVLFLSDATRELEAANQAGMHVRLVIRPGNHSVQTSHSYGTIFSLDELSAA
jgi:enolase-phosphatase E1